MRRLLPALSGMKNIITAVYAMRNTRRSVRRNSAMRRLLPALSGMKNIITADYAMRNTPGTVRRNSAMRRLLPALSGMKVIMTTLTITIIMDIIGLLNLIAIILRTAVTAQFAMQRKATTTVRRSFATRRLLLALSG